MTSVHGLVQRVICWFDRGTDELIGSAPLKDVALVDLQRMFNVPPDDPMYDCYPITASQATQLQAYVDVPIQLERFEYLLEAN